MFLIPYGYFASTVDFQFSPRLYRFLQLNLSITFTDIQSRLYYQFEIKYEQIFS